MKESTCHNVTYANFQGKKLKLSEMKEVNIDRKKSIVILFIIYFHYLTRYLLGVPESVTSEEEETKTKIKKNKLTFAYSYYVVNNIVIF